MRQQAGSFLYTVPTLDRAAVYCTLGETMNTLADVFGRHVEKPFI